MAGDIGTCHPAAMATLARFRPGRILLHVLAMLGDRAFRFHAGGILRELA
jgi:hypothetical protein